MHSYRKIPLPSAFSVRLRDDILDGEQGLNGGSRQAEINKINGPVRFGRPINQAINSSSLESPASRRLRLKLIAHGVLVDALINCDPVIGFAQTRHRNVVRVLTLAE